MIKLEKTNEPKVLVDNYSSWTSVLLQHEAAGTTPSKSEKSKYNHPDIKQALISETNGKCAYCESKFEHISYGDVEHVVAKSTDPKVYFRWSNLTIACDVCNTNKGGKSGLIDPYVTDPFTSFIFSGPLILPQSHSAEAQLTELTIKLNRTKLLERRSERIRRLHSVFVLAKTNPDQAVGKAIIEDMIENEPKAEQEFAAVVRAYISQVIAAQ